MKDFARRLLSEGGGGEAPLRLLRLRLRNLCSSSAVSASALAEAESPIDDDVDAAVEGSLVAHAASAGPGSLLEAALVLSRRGC